MFTAAPNTQTVSHTIVQYRDRLQKIIETTEHRDPLLILQDYLREYVATNSDSFFAARLIYQLNDPNANILALLNDYFAGARPDKQSHLYAALAAYFYYYADYYQIDHGLYSENSYPELIRQLIFPLQLYHLQDSKQFKEKFLDLVGKLDPTQDNFADSLNQVCASYPASEHRESVYQKLIASLKSDSNKIFLYHYLCELGVADEDKKLLITVAIEKLNYLSDTHRIAIFFNDDDAMRHLNNLCTHPTPLVRKVVGSQLNHYYKRASSERKSEIVALWLKQTNDDDIDVALSAWHLLLKNELPENSKALVYKQLLAHARYQHPQPCYDYQLPVTLSYYFLDKRIINHLENEQYQAFVDEQIRLVEPLDAISKACISQLVFHKLSETQKHKLIPIFKNLAVNENDMHALNALFHLPVDMALWEIMIDKQFTDLLGESLSTYKTIKKMQISDEQLHYATQFFLAKLRSTQAPEVIAACAGIRYYQHADLKESIILQIWHLINSADPIIASAAADTLQFLKPNILGDAFLDRLMQLIIQDQEDNPDLFFSLTALITPTNQAKVIAFLKKVAFTGIGNSFAITLLHELNIPMDKDLIAIAFKPDFYAEHGYIGLNTWSVPDELVEEVIPHLLKLMTPENGIATYDACQLLRQLPHVYDSEKVILTIATNLNDLNDENDLKLFAQEFLITLNQLETPPATHVPLAKSLIGLLKKCLNKPDQHGLWSYQYDLIKPLLNKIMQQASCADRCSILALLDSPDFTYLSLRSYAEKFKTDFIQPLVLTEEVRRKSELPYMPSEMWRQIQQKQI